MLLMQIFKSVMMQLISSGFTQGLEFTRLTVAPEGDKTHWFPAIYILLMADLERRRLPMIAQNRKECNLGVREAVGCIHLAPLYLLIRRQLYLYTINTIRKSRAQRPHNKHVGKRFAH